MTYFGESQLPCSRLLFVWPLTQDTTAGKDSSKILEYFERNGAPCPPDANPAEHIIEVVQGATTDWVDVWKNSDERKVALQELETLNVSGRSDPNYVENTADYATSHWYQFKMVAKRLTVQIWRSPVRQNKISPWKLPR